MSRADIEHLAYGPPRDYAAGPHPEPGGPAFGGLGRLLQRFGLSLGSGSAGLSRPRVRRLPKPRGGWWSARRAASRR